MAVLKIHVVRARLDKRINYVMNPEKTACKGFHSFFGIKDTLTSGFTCACDEAYQQMMETKQHEKKTDKVLGYHYIQSFKPGEVTPEEAHQVGCEFIERCFAEDFEVVIGTHTDHAHIHNHIILNSVSFVDGHKFQSTPASFYKLRAISDEICRAHHLSVIDDPKTRKAKHYAEWKAEQEYRPTIRNEIRRDIDVVLKQSHSLNNFWELLRLRGYEIKFNEKRKYAAIRPPNGKRFIRMKSLGEEYTPRELVKRLEAADKSEVATNRRAFQQKYQQRKHRKKYYALPWTIIPHRRLTLRGIRALYWRYVYMLSKVRARKAPRAVRGVMLDELKKLERYSQQYYFLRDNRLNTKAYTSTSGMKYSDGSIGKLSIPSIGVNKKVYDGETIANMRLGAAHFEGTSGWDGNVAMCGHNRGSYGYFGNIHTLKNGDTISYTTIFGTRTYKVYSVRKIAKTDTSVLDPSDANLITLITCVRDVPSQRWCVQAMAI